MKPQVFASEIDITLSKSWFLDRAKVDTPEEIVNRKNWYDGMRESTEDVISPSDVVVAEDNIIFTTV